MIYRSPNSIGSLFFNCPIHKNCYSVFPKNRLQVELTRINVKNDGSNYRRLKKNYVNILKNGPLLYQVKFKKIENLCLLVKLKSSYIIKMMWWTGYPPFIPGTRWSI